MLHRLIFVFLLTFALSASSQEELLSFKNDAKTSSSKIREIIPIVNDSTGELALFAFDSKMVYAYLLSDKFKRIDGFSLPFKLKYEQLLGASITANNDYRIFLANEKLNKFATVNFSYEKDSLTFKELPLDLKEERFLESLSQGNTFKVLTLSEKEALLNIYQFDEDANYKKQVVNFSEDLFLNKKNKEQGLHQLLEEAEPIERGHLNAIDMTAVPSKIYHDENELLISLDQNIDTVQLVLIDLNTFDKQVRRLPKPLNKINNKQKLSNSFIEKQHLFTIAATKDQFAFAMQDLKTGSVIKKFELTSEDTITFKNSSIIQIGAVYDKYRELEKTKKFLQKITYSQVGISVLETAGEYQVLLGGQHEYRATTGGMGMMRAAKNIQLSPGELLRKYFNPSLYAFNLYSNTQSTYIKSLLDKDFEHLKGDLKSNVFDKVKNAENGKVENEDLKTLFKYKDHYILGSYMLETGQFRLQKFKN